jgi:pSer/pThr/pTyr-binding forkhead associated (FHA) protein
MKARIRVLNGPLAGQTVEIGARLLVGRDTDCDLRPPREFVSRHHCVFLVDDFTVRIRDLGSKNGTFVNGHRIATGEMIPLHHADLVSVGETTFIIEFIPPPVEPDDQSTPSSAELKATGLFDTRTVEDGAAAPPPPADKRQEDQRPLA